jgi:hypothetical protein
MRPGEYDAEGPLPYAFEYTGIDRTTGLRSATLSFSVKGEATPRDALAATSRQSAVRRVCGTGKRAPSPEVMYDAGFRVAALPARDVLDACRAPGAGIHIAADGVGNEVEPNGHLQLYGGAGVAEIWARLSRTLTRGETFPEP